MAVSFAGLFVPRTTVLNQYGFVLFIGVVVDTFLVRPVLVPAAIAVAGVQGVNWWPRSMPPPVVDEDTEAELVKREGDVPSRNT